VPHVIECIDASPPPLEVDASRFVFASVCTWDRRKRPDLLLHAFLQAFTDADEVTLVLKTHPQVLSWNTANTVQRQTWWQVMQIVRQYPNPADVVLVTDQWTDGEMAGLLQRADCYVSLTSVEGWGLGAFDAAVAGVPLIITGYGGQLEWLGDDHPGLVPFTIADADHPDRSMFEPGMTWAVADVEAAAEMMRGAVDGTGGFLAAAPSLATRLAQQYSEHAVGTTMKRLLG
jgi:glycosyltransferase involved in cell wall biosynthesis